MNRKTPLLKTHSAKHFLNLAAGVLALALPMTALSHELVPESPVDRRPNLDFIQEEETGFITGSGGKGYEWHFYKNYSYACGRKGFHTFVVADPVLTHEGAEGNYQGPNKLPLLIRFRGGGVGYFDEYQTYHGNGEKIINEESPAQSPLDEESANALTSHLLNDGLMKKVTADNEANFRILVISYCDHDIYGGVGEIDPNNPFPPVDNPLTNEVEDLPRTTAGLLAAKAAFQHAKQLFPTHNSEVVLYGTSAGGGGVLNFSTSFGRKGISFAGAVSDSGGSSPWAEAFVQSDCNDWMKPAESFFGGIASRIGPYFGPKFNAITAVIDGSLTTPVFMIWSRGDKSACGETEIAIDSDGDGAHELFWSASEVMSRPLAQVLDSHNPGGASRWLRVCVQDHEYRGKYNGLCDQHSSTLYDKQDTDGFNPRHPYESPSGPDTEVRTYYDGNYNEEIYGWILHRIGQ